MNHNKRITVGRDNRFRPAVACGLSAVLVLVFAVSGLGQRPDIIYPDGVHVPELERYFDQVEIYAPIHYRHFSVYPIRLRDGDTLRGPWLTLDRALARGVLLITEKGAAGQVPVVVVENQSREDYVFIMSGELLAGGKQSRSVRDDLVLAPGQRVDVQVFCVEAHRWEGQPRFLAGKTALPQSITKELRKGADQTRVWSEVARNNRALDAENPTGSLELALNSPAVRSKLDELRGKVVPELPGDTVGFIFAHHGRAVGADFFGRTDLAAALLPKLLDSYGADLVLQPSEARPAGGPDRRDDAVALFQRIRRAGSQRTTTPASGAGMRTRSHGLVGSGVSLGGVVVHYGVQVEHRILPVPRRKPSIDQPQTR
jgi:hypothetical protein